MDALSQNEKERLFLLSDYELLKQELNGLHIIAKSGIDRSILVTSHYADPLVQAQAAKTGTKILPKQLASEIVIAITARNEDYNSEKVAAIFVDDDKRLTNSLILYAFHDEEAVETYQNPEHFLQNVHKYPKDTKIFLDNNFATSELTGIDIAKILHEQGYTQLYLLSGQAFSQNELPGYITLIGKNQIEKIKEVVK
jgi:hypothetical protein